MLTLGDTISIPVHVFRGFENVGTDVGFMFAILAGTIRGASIRLRKYSRRLAISGSFFSMMAG